MWRIYRYALFLFFTDWLNWNKFKILWNTDDYLQYAKLYGIRFEVGGSVGLLATSSPRSGRSSVAGRVVCGYRNDVHHGVTPVPIKLQTRVIIRSPITQEASALPYTLTRPIDQRSKYLLTFHWYNIEVSSPFYYSRSFVKYIVLPTLFVFLQ